MCHDKDRNMPHLILVVNFICKVQFEMLSHIISSDPAAKEVRHAFYYCTGIFYCKAQWSIL